MKLATFGTFVMKLATFGTFVIKIYLATFGTA